MFELWKFKRELKEECYGTRWKAWKTFSLGTYSKDEFAHAWRGRDGELYYSFGYPNSIAERKAAAMAAERGFILDAKGRSLLVVLKYMLDADGYSTQCNNRFSLGVAMEGETESFGRAVLDDNADFVYHCRNPRNVYEDRALRLAKISGARVKTEEKEPA